MIENKAQAEQSLTALFRQAKNEVRTNIPVSTMAVIKEISVPYDAEKKYGCAMVSPLPMWDKDCTNSIEAYFFADKVSPQDIVLVVFTDYDFRINIKTNPARPIRVVNTNVHSKNFGVIIPLKGE